MIAGYSLAALGKYSIDSVALETINYVMPYGVLHVYVLQRQTIKNHIAWLRIGRSIRRRV